MEILENRLREWPPALAAAEKRLSVAEQHCSDYKKQVHALEDEVREANMRVQALEATAAVLTR